MEIGKQIKLKRIELNMTQECLAQKINVGRSTISNWENERNYPDIQTIIQLSDVLEISLDQLLRGDVKIVEQLTQDTKIRKKQSRKIKLLYVIVVGLLMISSVVWYKQIQYQQIENPDTIVSAKIIDDQLEIVADLPFYRSLSSYMMENDSDDTIIMSVGDRIDWSMKNTEYLIIDFSFWDSDKYKTLNIIDTDYKVLKTLKIEK